MRRIGRCVSVRTARFVQHGADCGTSVARRCRLDDWLSAKVNAAYRAHPGIVCYVGNAALGKSRSSPGRIRTTLASRAHPARDRRKLRQVPANPRNAPVKRPALACNPSPGRKRQDRNQRTWRFAGLYATGRVRDSRAGWDVAGSEAGGRLCQNRQQKVSICRIFSTGATGLKPATSGVTGRYGAGENGSE